ncbi:MAG TPA: DNA polymerase domain-containing protein [Candidatus Thermoplasmatota archaeon]|nr:DNA polymerase domain-containing protein [Candidatus Thermoplasmatota archaeon]
MIAWVKQGSRTTPVRIPYQPSFLVTPLHRPLRDVERLFAKDKRVKAMRRTQAILWLKGHPQEVLEIQPHRFTDLQKLAVQVRKDLGCTSYELYNVDIPFPSRWTQENDIFPFAKVRLDGSAITSIDDRWAMPYDVPDLRCVRLTVLPDVQGVVPSHTDPIAEIRWEGRVIPARDRERNALLDLQALIDAEDPDVYFTVGGDRWDIPYLLARVERHNLRHQVQLGRFPDPQDASQKERSFSTYGKIVYRTDAWFLRGRLHIDLSKKFLPDSEDRTSLHGIIYLARTSNSDPQRLARNSPGSCIQQTQIDRAREEGVQIPWKRNLVERLKPLTTMVNVDRGGQVHVPEPGVYDNAWSCDFSGYYPSLIVAHNLSSETINCDCCPDSDKTVPGTDWHLCKRRDGHQARTLRPFVEHRRYVKAILRRSDQTHRHAWASAIKDELKAIGVVCFGYARYKHARFGCAEVHQAIQALGRHGMTRAKRVAEENGFERLHTLTDGMIIRKPGANRAEVEALARRIAREADVPMEIDAQFDWVVLLPSKMVPGIGVPNRYYGKRNNGELKVRGIEVRRHNTSPWLRRSQERVLAVLSRARNAREFHRLVPAALREAKLCTAELAAVPLEDLAITVTVTKDVEEYAQETHTRIALRKLRQAGIAVQPGQAVSYVVLRGSESAADMRAVPVQLLDREGPFSGPPLRPSIEHYVGLLARSMETLLACLGLNDLTASQALRGSISQQQRLRP